MGWTEAPDERPQAPGHRVHRREHGFRCAGGTAQTALTNAAAGIMTSGIAGSAMLGLKKGGQLARTGAGAIGQGFFWGQQAMADPAAATQQLVDRFKNINKPGGGAA